MKSISIFILLIYWSVILLAPVISKEDKVAIEAPEKGKEITKKDYTLTVREKMVEMRSNRMGRRG
mgnify:CR=1 FL=1